MQQERFPQASVRGVTYDAGLRAHFSRVYNTMALGLVVTGAVSYGVLPINSLAGRPMKASKALLQPR